MIATEEAAGANEVFFCILRLICPQAWRLSISEGTFALYDDEK
jgi:hypothetical protein